MESQMDGGSSGGSAIVGIIYLGIMALMIASMWKINTKAGQPGWACLVPFYNIIVMLKIAGKPAWWLVLMFIPLVNIVVAIMMTAGLARAFGKGTGFTVGLLLLGLVFYPILAFGDAEYQGTDGTPGQSPQFQQAA
jgi:hypothetical protein